MKSMVDYINKCIACNELSYEVENKEHSTHTYVLYKCSNCGFEWEVIECGDEGPV